MAGSICFVTHHRTCCLPPIVNTCSYYSHSRETELGCIFWMHYEKNRLTTSSWKSHKQAKKKKSLEPL